MNYRERLRDILGTKSIKRGDFALSSGKRSNYYLDARLTTLDAEGAYCTGHAVLEVLRTLSPYPKAIGGLTLGADPIVAVVAALSYHNGPPVSGFLVRKEPKAHGTRQLIEGWQGRAGDSVVILDDVCTTGGSTLKAIEQAVAAGYRVTAAICLVDRQEGGREAIEKHCPYHALFTARELLSSPAEKAASANPG